MGTKTKTVSATSNWRDSEDEAKRECNRILDMKVEDVVSDEDHDGWELVSGSYSGYKTEFNQSRNEHRCSRSKTLRFKEYQAVLFGGGSVASVLDEPVVSLETFNDFIHRRIDTDEFIKHLPNVSLETLPEGAKVRLEEFRNSFRWQNSGFDMVSLKQAVMAALPQMHTVWIDGPFGIKIAIPAPLVDASFHEFVITSSKLRLGDNAELVGLPLEESVSIIPFSNCGESELEIQRNREYQYTTGYRIEFSQSVTEHFDLKGSLTFEGVGGIEAGFSKEVTLSQTNEYSATKTEMKSESLNISIKPGTKGTIRLTSQVFEARRSFEGPIVIDCNVTAIYQREGTAHVSHRLSALLPSEEPRTIQSAGYYSNLDTRVQPIEITPEPCP